MTAEKSIDFMLYLGQEYIEKPHSTCCSKAKMEMEDQNEAIADI
jgi:hypothetical protein